MENSIEESDDISIDCQLPMKNEKYIVFQNLKGDGNLKGNKYTIDFKILQSYSLYFSKRHNFQNEQLLSFYCPSFVKEVDSFINACQNRMFKIKKTNVFSLHYLSKRFEVPILKQKVEKFIDENHNQLLIECLEYKVISIKEITTNDFYNENFDIDEFFDIQFETKALGKSLDNYLEDTNYKKILLSLPISVFYDILNHYTTSHPQENMNYSLKENNLIFDFVSEYIERNGSQASMIFSLFKIGLDDIKKIESSKHIKVDYSYISNTLDTSKADIINLDTQFTFNVDEEIQKLKSQISKLEGVAGDHHKACKLLDDSIYREMNNKQ